MLVAVVVLCKVRNTCRPTIRSDVPMLISRGRVVRTGSVVGLMGSFSDLVNPIVKNTLFTFFNVCPVLCIDVAYFVVSTVVSVFVSVPFMGGSPGNGVFTVKFSSVGSDLNCVVRSGPVVLGLYFVVTIVGFLLATLVVVKLPMLVARVLGFSPSATGGLCKCTSNIVTTKSLINNVDTKLLSRGLGTGGKCGALLFYSLALVPVNLTVFLSLSSVGTCFLVVVSYFIVVVLTALFSIRVVSCLRVVAPGSVLKGVVSYTDYVKVYTAPLNRMVCNKLFSVFGSEICVIVFVTVIVAYLVSMGSGGVFLSLSGVLCLSGLWGSFWGPCMSDVLVCSLREKTLLWFGFLIF